MRTFNNQENMKCIFQAYQYKYIVIIIFILILFGFIYLNIMVYNKLVYQAKDRFSEWTKIEAEKNDKLLRAINKKLTSHTEDDITPDIL